jgi:hypothetical protein
MKGQCVAAFGCPQPRRSLTGEGDLLAAEARLVADHGAGTALALQAVAHGDARWFALNRKVKLPAAAATTAVIVARMITIELGLGLQRNWGCIHSLATLSFSGAKYPQQSTLRLVWAPRAECNPYGDSAPHPEHPGTRPHRQARGLGGELADCRDDLRGAVG